MIGTIPHDWRAFTIIRGRDIADYAAATLLAILTFPLLRRHRRSETRGQPRAHMWSFVIATALLPVVVRLALLPWVQRPEPHYHDEFGHLLVADTLASGRLANPPHPLWRHLQTIYVLQQPTYSSVYPIGQGAIMAAGKVLFGDPWAGVLLATALMCGAITWMLYGCLPPFWAAIGGLLAALQYGLAPDWIDSFWGGAFCAFGGALAFGALFRLQRAPSMGMGVILGFGWSVVWLTRPFESALVLLFLWAAIALFAVRDRAQWRRWTGPIAMVALVQLLAGVVTIVHNRAVTGSYTTLPYLLGQRVYGAPQTLMWQKPVEPPAFSFAESKQMYDWQRQAKEEARAEPLSWLAYILFVIWWFFITTWNSLPIMVALFAAKDWRVRFAWAILGCAICVAVLYPFFFAHYLGAYAGLIMLLIVWGLTKISEWRFLDRAVGLALVLFLIWGLVLARIRAVPIRTVLGGRGITPAMASLRTRVSQKLAALGPRHVVFVRYGPKHILHDEWVYNAADIDRSPIVWCRASDPADDAEVTNYYKDRRFWLASVDKDEVEISPYDPGGGGAGLNVSSATGPSTWVLKRAAFERW